MFKKLFCTKAMLLGLLGMAMPLMAVDSSWEYSVDNNWSHPAYWTNDYAPRNTVDNATIAFPATVSIGGFTPFEDAPQLYPNINSLNITDPGAVLNLNYNINLGLNGGSVNNGTINIDSLYTTHNSSLNINSSLTMSGVGTIKLCKDYYARLNTYNGAVLTQGEGHTIAGTGQLNANLVNNGTVNANVSGQPLNIVTNDKVNNSLFTATNGGVLNITDGRTIDQTGGGKILADTGTVVIQNGARINGGELDSNPTGALDINGTSYYKNVTNSGKMDIKYDTYAYISGLGITNNGTINVNSINTTHTTRIAFEETGSLMGTGDLKLVKDYYSRLVSLADATVTNGPDHTIHGTGELEAKLVNDGLVIADVDSNELSLTTNDKTNNNRMTATDGGVLYVGGVTVTQDDDAIIEADGGIVKLYSNGMIMGGKVDTKNDGEMWVSHIRMSDVTNQGRIDTYMNGYLDILGDGITNNGQIVIDTNNYTGTTYLRFLEDGMLTGNGEVKLVKQYYSRLAGADDSIVVTNDVAHTIRGAGELQVKLINNNMVVADVPGYTLDINVIDKVNNGTIKATNTGTANFSGITVTQGENGLIEADGGIVKLNNSATIVGGTVDTVNDGIFKVESSAILQDVTNAGRLDIIPGALADITGGKITNNGDIDINKLSHTSTTYLRFPVDGLLTGTGTVNLGKSYYSRISAPNGVTVTNDTEHTIRGCGDFEAAMINDGLILSDTDQIRLSIYGTVNNSTLKVTNGATFYLDGVAVDQSAGGTFIADNGTVKLANGASIKGGTLLCSGDGIFRIEGRNYFDNVTNEGVINAGFGGYLDIKGGQIINNGTIENNIESYTYTTYCEFPEDTVLAGTGEMRLGKAYYSRIVSTAPEHTVTNSETHTIRGAGIIDAEFVNDGTLIADLPNQELQFEGDEVKTNNNLIKTQDNGIFRIYYDTVNQGPDGVIEADNGSFKLVQSTLNGGTITTSNGGNIIIEDSSTLNGVTNNGDMTVWDGRILTIGADSIENNGYIKVNPSGWTSTTLLSIPNSVTLTGNGSIEMGRSYYTRLSVAENQTLTNGPEHTIGGRAYFYGNIVNQGTVKSTGELRVVNNLSFEPGSTYQAHIVPGANGTMVAEGMVAFNGGNIKITFGPGSVVQAGQYWKIIDDLPEYGGHVLYNVEPVLDAPDLANGLKIQLTFDDHADLYASVVACQECGDVPDCNGNGIADYDDIEMGVSQDVNGNGIPDECDIPGDIDGDMDVDITDFTLALNLWLMQDCEPCLQLDMDDNGIINLVEFSVLADNWLLGTE